MCCFDNRIMTIIALLKNNSNQDFCTVLYIIMFFLSFLCVSNPYALSVLTLPPPPCYPAVQASLQ